MIKKIKEKTLLFLFIVLLYFLIVVVFQYLHFPPRLDESHFWQTSVLFSKGMTFEKITNYNELNTPLPFILFGVVEYFFKGGVAVARLINLIFSFIIINVILFSNKKNIKKSIFSALGLFIFPYFILTSTHVYTDIIASFFVLFGFVFYKKNKHFLSTISFILAISSRQYMLAFPLAIFIYEYLTYKSKKNWVFYLVSSSSILFWVILFGGFGPEKAIQIQNISTINLFFFIPHNSLYFLACIGLYFVIPEIIFFKRFSIFKDILSKKNLYISISLIILFLLFPPLRNMNYNIESMGFLDVSIRVFFNDFFRMCIFFIFAFLSCVRFSKYNLASILLIINCLIMIKAHIAWDKYVLPLIIVFWYLKSRKEL